MNTLSIFIYLIEILSKIGSFVGVVSVITFGIFVLAAFVGLLAHDISDKPEYRSGDVAKRKEMDDANAKSFSSYYRSLFRKWIWVPIIFAVLSLVIPSQQTMYMIAGSELAQVSFQSEVGQEVYGIVLDKLKEFSATPSPSN